MKIRIKYALAVIVGILILGPTAIHQFYRAVTPAEFKKQQTALYNDIANTELKLSGDERDESINRRIKLFYWFHSRGWGIDEDDEKESIFNDWRELFRYWLQD